MPPPDLHDHAQPDVIAAVRDDLADWRAWLSRAVILAYAAAAGGRSQSARVPLVVNRTARPPRTGALAASKGELQ